MRRSYLAMPPCPMGQKNQPFATSQSQTCGPGIEFLSSVVSVPPSLIVFDIIVVGCECASTQFCVELHIHVLCSSHVALHLIVQVGSRYTPWKLAGECVSMPLSNRFFDAGGVDFGGEGSKGSATRRVGCGGGRLLMGGHGSAAAFTCSLCGGLRIASSAGVNSLG